MTRCPAELYAACSVSSPKHNPEESGAGISPVPETENPAQAVTGLEGPSQAVTEREGLTQAVNSRQGPAESVTGRQGPSQPVTGREGPTQAVAVVAPSQPTFILNNIKVRRLEDLLGGAAGPGADERPGGGDGAVPHSSSIDHNYISGGIDGGDPGYKGGSHPVSREERRRKEERLNIRRYKTQMSRGAEKDSSDSSEQEIDEEEEEDPVQLSTYSHVPLPRAHAIGRSMGKIMRYIPSNSSRDNNREVNNNKYDNQNKTIIIN